jgi:hypothetical protein
MRTLFLGALGLLAAAGPAWAQGKDTGYLTRDGKLIRKLEVSDLQGGVAGFTGDRWALDPSGDWTQGRVRDRELKIEHTGKLTGKQLDALTREFARYDLLSLKSHRVGRPTANPHVVTIQFGTHKAELTLPPGSKLPRPDPKTVPGRYAGILQALQKALVEKSPAARGSGG